MVRTVCDLTVERYSFFEAQKGKTSLDSHFATFEFSLKRRMKRGFDLLLSEDIVEGIKEHLKGTNVYETHLDRTKEPRSAKTFDGITSFADFTYNYSNLTITSRELTNTGPTVALSQKKIRRLWPDYLSKHCLSTGVTSEYNESHAENIEPKFKKQKVPRKTKRSKENIPTENDATKHDDNVYPNCHQVYVRKGPMKKHLLSEKCMRTRKFSSTLEEVKSSMPVMQALGLASNVRDIKSNRLEQLQRMDKSPVVSLYFSLLQGSAHATKTKLPKSNRFTDEQKDLKENCFETEKKNRYTPQSCKQLLEERLGKEMGLTEQFNKSKFTGVLTKGRKLKRQMNEHVLY